MPKSSCLAFTFSMWSINVPILWFLLFIYFENWKTVSWDIFSKLIFCTHLQSPWCWFFPLFILFQTYITIGIRFYKLSSYYFFSIIAAERISIDFTQKTSQCHVSSMTIFKDSFKQLYASPICTLRQIVRINKTAHTPTFTDLRYIYIVYTTQTNDIQVHFGTNLFSRSSLFPLRKRPL